MSDLEELDPDKLALLYVQQWLSENGYKDALQALGSQAGLLYDEDKLKQGSQLMQLVWSHIEGQLERTLGEDELARRAEEEALLRGGCRDYVQGSLGGIEVVHPANITCVRLWPARTSVVTGSGDGCVRMLDFSGAVEWVTKVGSGGVLCTDIHPQARSGESSLIAAGSMDGSVTVLEGSRGAALASTRPHSKYVVRAIWGGDGSMLVCCSPDQSVSILRFSHAAAEGATAELVSMRQVPYVSPVQDITFLSDGHTLVVATKGSNYLRLLDTQDAQAREQVVNMNERGDDHVSFTARHLALSPCGRHLLVSTDTPRMLMLRTSDWSHARAFFGVPTEQFHNPCAAWHYDGHYVYAAGSDAQVHVFHVGTCKVVARLAGHKINVRDLAYDPDRNLLATCSFDKSVRLYQGPAPT